jgi:hypothetical protein
VLLVIGLACERGGLVGVQGPRDAPRRSEECGNGLDDDADDSIDEGCPCGRGERQGCFPGASEARSVGRCADGLQACATQGDVEFGTWSSCDGSELAVDEQCNAFDDDCDGAVDETCPCAEGQSRACADLQLPAPCTDGTQTCRQGRWSSCEGAVLPSVERCGDRIDNDCDGEAEEGCDCTPSPEVCANDVDDDCDGATDEPACQCTEASRRCPSDGGVDDGGDGGVVDAGQCRASPCWPVLPQCGCAPGEGCYGLNPERRVCATAGSIGELGLCEASSECEPGLGCWGVDLRVCTPYCERSSDCASGDCWGVADVGICPIVCDPIEADSVCPETTFCFVFNSRRIEDGALSFNSICTDSGTNDLGESCTTGRCQPGQLCVSEVCRELCVPGDVPCSGPGTCRRLNPAATIRGTEYGACI